MDEKHQKWIVIGLNCALAAFGIALMAFGYPMLSVEVKGVLGKTCIGGGLLFVLLAALCIYGTIVEDTISLKIYKVIVIILILHQLLSGSVFLPLSLLKVGKTMFRLSTHLYNTTLYDDVYEFKKKFDCSSDCDLQTLYTDYMTGKVAIFSTLMLLVAVVEIVAVNLVKPEIPITKTKTIKYLSLALCISISIHGLGLLGLGSAIRTKEFTQLHSSIGYFGIAHGLILLLIVSLGILGIVRKRAACLYAYRVILIVHTVMCTLVGLVVALVHGVYPSAFDFLRTEDQIFNRTDRFELAESLQKAHNCCGFSNITDSGCQDCMVVYNEYVSSSFRTLIGISYGFTVVSIVAIVCTKAHGEGVEEEEGSQ